MSLFRTTLLALALACTATTVAAAQDFVVIVNEAVPSSSLPADELVRVFQRVAVRWPNGLSVEPVDQSDDSPVRARFSNHVFQKTVSQVKAWWQTQLFAGRGVPPVELPSDAAVLSFVQTHAGAIGYVSATTALPAGVRRLRVAR